MSSVTITINPDVAEVERIRRAVRENDGYCPCQLEKNENTRCMCKNFVNSEQNGWCHCGLYFKTIN